MKLKRVFAYLIDLLLVLFISTLIFNLPIFKDSYDNYIETSEKALKDLNVEKIEDDEILTIEYNVYKSSTDLLIIKLGVTFLYFGVISYIFNGKTLGKKIFRLRVKPNKGERLNAPLYMLRSIILTNLILNTISIILLISCTKSTWLEANNIIAILTYLIELTLLLSMMINANGRGLHDLICNTYVIEEGK